MKLGSAARTILEKRYLEEGETPEERFLAVAKAVASVEPERIRDHWADTYYEMMTNLDFLPNTPTLMNAGRENGQLSACFVLPIEDSMHGIFSTLYNAAMIQKSGGGTGFSFSRLRPKGALVSSTRGVSSGPVSFMRVYNAASEEVEQGGARRGACMAVMSVYHPDIEEFITCKDKEGELANFNISVAIDGNFLDKVHADKDIRLVHNDKLYRVVRAQHIMNLITKQAWKNGEPGILFIDMINRFHPTKYLGQIESTNPCGEQPLLPYESCNLGSINLANMLTRTSGKLGFDWDKLRQTVEFAVRFLDSVVDINIYPLPEIADATLKTRKIGLGVMGWATALHKMEIPYDSDTAINLGKNVMDSIEKVAYKTSMDLGEKKGVFPAYSKAVDTFQPRRNAALLTIAPTGSLATIAGVSYGIEPLFGLLYQKKMADRTFTVVDEEFDAAIRTNIHYDDIVNRVKEIGSCQSIDEVPEEVKEVFKIGTEIPWKRHIEMQASFQRFTDNAVSKTINMPENSTPKDIEDAIFFAYSRGCKGLTVYRKGSRVDEAVSIGTKKDKVKLQFVQSAPTPTKRPTSLTGVTERKDTPLGPVYMTLNSYEGNPFELFTLIGKAGNDVAAFTEAIARLISLAFRCGIDPQMVAEQLTDIGGGRGVVGFGPNKVKSVPDAMGQFILSHLSKGEKVVSEELPRGAICPGCGAASLITQSGCTRCTNCQFKEC